MLRERVGAREIDLEIDKDTTPEALVVMLTRRVPEIADFASSIRLAVNRIYAGPDTIIRPGDEVAVITPVSGG